MSTTAIFSKQLVDVCLYNIYLIKSGIFITAMYKGAFLIGVICDFKEVPPKELANVLNDVIPKNINNVDKFKSKYSNRVDYGVDANKQEYHFISENDYYKSKEVSETITNN